MFQVGMCLGKEGTWNKTSKLVINWPVKTADEGHIRITPKEKRLNTI
jgi:hypothetical protein